MHYLRKSENILFDIIRLVLSLGLLHAMISLRYRVFIWSYHLDTGHWSGFWIIVRFQLSFWLIIQNPDQYLDEINKPIKKSDF